MLYNINKSIDELFSMLSWKNDEHTQRKGIEEAKKIKREYLFILIYCKSPDIGENCAKALSELSDESLKPFIIELVEWIQDLNWPGAVIILDRLKKFEDCKTLARVITRSIKTALVCDEQHWLKSMSELLDNDGLKTELTKEALDVLFDRYHWYED